MKPDDFPVQNVVYIEGAGWLTDRDVIYDDPVTMQRLFFAIDGSDKITGGYSAAAVDQSIRAVKRMPPFGFYRFRSPPKTPSAPR